MRIVNALAGRGRAAPSMVGVMASMEACIPSLRRYARSLLRDRDEVDDLVHDCLVRALDQLHTRREDGDLRAWLFAIMHNLFISRVRRNKRRGQLVSLDEAGDDRFGMPATQDGHMQGRDLLRAAQRIERGAAQRAAARHG